MECALSWVVLLCVAAAPPLSQAQNSSSDYLTWQGPCALDDSDPDLACDQTNTVLLGGLFPLHTWVEDKTHALGGYCGDVIQQVGFQRMEAMRFAIEDINRQNVIPGVRLAFEMRDSCISTEHTKQQAVRFVNRAIEDGKQCNDSVGHAISGVVGAAASGSSIAAADLLGLFKIPQISYASTSATLSDKDRYRYFLRTVPPDNIQAQAIISILDALNVSYFSLLYSEGSYGVSGAAEVRDEINARQMSSQGLRRQCIATDRAIGVNSADLPGGVYRGALDDLRSDVSKNASFCVVFAGIHSAVGLLEEAVRVGAQLKLKPSDNRVWIASDAWAGAQDVLNTFGFQLIAKGLIGVSPRSSKIAEFDNHFLSLTPDNSSGPTSNPWFNEFWTSVFSCDPESPEPSERAACRDNSLANISHTTYTYKQNKKVAFVIDAVRAFAFALRNYQQDRCGNGFQGICSEMLSLSTGRQRAINGEELLRYLLTLQFTSSTGLSASFTDSGDLATARYGVTNLHVDSLNRGHYVNVGEWERLPQMDRRPISNTITNGVLERVNCLAQAAHNTSNCTLFHLKLNISAIQWHNGGSGIQSKPASQCSEPCMAGYSSKHLEHPFPPRVFSCCWSCSKCSENWYTLSQFEKCRQCPPKEKSNANRTGCERLTVDYWNAEHGEAIVGIILSSLGLIVIAITAIVGVSVKHLLPMHSGLEIESLLYCLTGTAGLCTTVFITLGKPTDLKCAVADVWISVSTALLFGALLMQFIFVVYEHLYDKRQETKRVLSAKISQATKPKTFQLKRKHVHLSMAVIMAALVAIVMVTIAIDPPKVHEDVTPNFNWIIGCRPSLALIFGLVYNVAIAIATIVARIYCLRVQLHLHSTLKKAAMLMALALLVSVATIVASSVLSSSTAQTAVIIFVLLAIVFASLFIVLIPDLFKSLAPKRDKEELPSPGKTPEDNESLFDTALNTIRERSLFSSHIRRNSERGVDSQSILSSDSQEQGVSNESSKTELRPKKLKFIQSNTSGGSTAAEKSFSGTVIESPIAEDDDHQDKTEGGEKIGTRRLSKEDSETSDEEYRV